ncbi:unnamed protein product [Parnassius mnemosyne]|uniref:Protein kinase domain-containing protein n=1 Tax=Parnassius mnemosyne TaxID=213953 RepID=A0AAV1M7L7_9NEOP
MQCTVPTLLLLWLAVLRSAQAGACDRLLANYVNSSFPALEVMVRGEPREVVVQSAGGAGRAGRALAALLAAAARRLRYPRVRLLPPPHSHTHDSPATAARINLLVKVGCDNVEGLRMDAAPHLHVRLAPHAHHCYSARVWPFYAHESNLRDCDFLRVADLAEWRGYSHETNEANDADEANECPQCAVVLAPPQLRGAAAALRQRALSHALLLRVLLSDTLHPAPPANNHSILFLDQSLWDDKREVHVVQAPPCPTHLETDCDPDFDSQTPIEITGDHVTLRYYAPNIFDTVGRFAPKPHHIRELLRLEMENGGEIEEAACEWSLTNPENLNDWLATETINYRVRVYVCRNDPDRAEYEMISREILSIIKLKNVMLEVNITSTECSHGEDLHKHFLSLLNMHWEQRTIGWVAAGVGTAQVAKRAQDVDLPFIIYDAPPIALRPDSGVRAVTGSVQVLARSYLHLLKRCGYQRVAVILENTDYARELLTIIREGGLLIRQRNISSQESIYAILKEFREVDARVFFVNANASVAAQVVCAAQKADMTSNSKYVWLVREWRGAVPCAGARSELKPLSVSLTWRGGYQVVKAAVPRSDECAAGREQEGARCDAFKVRRALDARWSHRAWPPLGASLADGLLLLVHTFASFLSRHPESAFDRRVFGTAKIFSEAINHTLVKGVIQELKYNNNNQELSSSLVFLDRWNDKQRSLLAVWNMTERDVQLIYEREQICTSGFVGPSSCLTTSSGDPFAPRCHDFAWLTLTIIMIIAPIGLFYARRARIHRLKLRDLALLEQILEQRKSNYSKFASYVVQRNEFELREELGSGAHGHVRVAVLRRLGKSPLAVAAKEAREEKLLDEAELIREACVLASLKHENIICFLGICLDGKALLFMEYAFFGDLWHYLRTRRPLAEFACSTFSNSFTEEFDVVEATYVSAPALTQLAAQAAAPLDYLATKRIVHRDVRAANCLIDETRTLKLADFGLARALAGEKEEYIQQHFRRLPVTCMAPESLMNDEFSNASDVWALGVLMLELVTLGTPPYGECVAAKIMRRLRVGEHPPLPPDVTPLA